MRNADPDANSDGDADTDFNAYSLAYSYSYSYGHADSGNTDSDAANIPTVGPGDSSSVGVTPNTWYCIELTINASNTTSPHRRAPWLMAVSPLEEPAPSSDLNRAARPQ